jgi:tRNA pseudouridine38-40 synthase
MQRIKCTVSYDGTAFNGYQVQPGQRTVQGVLEKALTKVHKGKDVKVISSGRTDAGVHAIGQVFHFDTDFLILEEKWPVVLNSILPDEVVITSAKYVEDDFHARYSVKQKEYRYKVRLGKRRCPFARDFSLHYPYPLNIEAIQIASHYLVGKHDFTSFCSTKTEKENKIRTIHSIKVEQEDNELTFSFTGNGFLYNMVRIIVGTLLEVGSGRKKPEDMPVILKKMDRKAAGKTAAAHGLYLWAVQYEEKSKLGNKKNE